MLTFARKSTEQSARYARVSGRASREGEKNVSDLLSKGRRANVTEMPRPDNLRVKGAKKEKEKPGDVAACSSRVAYDKCKRSRVDEAIREASVVLLTHDVHTRPRAYTFGSTYDNVRVTLMKLVLGKARKEAARRHVE